MPRRKLAELRFEGTPHEMSVELLWGVQVNLLFSLKRFRQWHRAAKAAPSFDWAQVNTMRRNARANYNAVKKLLYQISQLHAVPENIGRPPAVPPGRAEQVVADLETMTVGAVAHKYGCSVRTVARIRAKWVRENAAEREFKWQRGRRKMRPKKEG